METRGSHGWGGQASAGMWLGADIYIYICCMEFWGNPTSCEQLGSTGCPTRERDPTLSFANARLHAVHLPCLVNK